MDNSTLENKNKNKKGKIRMDMGEGSAGQDQFRVVISNEANSLLEEFTNKVNEGFEAGSVSKSDLANYIFSNLDKHISDSDVKTLRSLHFDDRRVLSSMLKKGANQEDLPEDIKKAIRAHYGVSIKPESAQKGRGHNCKKPQTEPSDANLPKESE